MATGANQGVGLQIAKELLSNNYIVYLGSRNLNNGEKAAALLGDNAYTVQLDVTKQETITAAMAYKKSGRLDLLVNNAGISHCYQKPIFRQFF